MTRRERPAVNGRSFTARSFTAGLQGSACVTSAHNLSRRKLPPYSIAWMSERPFDCILGEQGVNTANKRANRRPTVINSARLQAASRISASTAKTGGGELFSTTCSLSCRMLRFVYILPTAPPIDPPMAAPIPIGSAFAPTPLASLTMPSVDCSRSQAGRVAQEGSTPASIMP